MSDSSFIRSEMLQPQIPPVSERGIVKWLRENLFSGWLNSILTILAVVALYFGLSNSLPWVLNGVWDAGSLSDCRAILAARGEDAVGACWAVLSRWNQFIYGFYPEDQRWRVNLVYLMGALSLAGLLIPRVPFKGANALFFFVICFSFVRLLRLRREAEC